MKPRTSVNSSLLTYFLWVFLFSVPIWIISALLGNKLPIPINLPISAFLFLIPVTTASVLVFRKDGRKGVKELLGKTFDYKKIKHKIWYLPALFLMPSVYLLAYFVMRWVGAPLPVPNVPFLMAPVFFILFFIGAACEELGWSGFAIDLMQKRWGALRASILLGFVWQIWHIIGDVQANNPAIWIVWQCLFSVALRVLIVWIYNHTGKSVFAAILIHTSDNVSWSLFPNYGSGYDPFFTCIIAWLVVIVVIFRRVSKTQPQL